MGGARTLLKQREALLGVAVAALVLVGGVFGVVVSKHGRDQQVQAEVARDMASDAGRVQADISSVVDDARRIAGQVSVAEAFVPALATAASPVALGVGFAHVNGQTTTVQGGIGITADALEARRSALDLARDTGVPRALVDLAVAGGGTRSYIGAPSYRASALIASSTITTDERRADLIGYVLVGIDLDAIGAEAARTAVAVSVRPAEATDAPVRTTTTTASTTLDIAGATWTVVATGSAPSSMVPGEAATLLLAALVAAVVVVGGLVTGRARLASEAAADSALLRARLLTSMAPLLQETLDLGMVLPEIATRVRDELDLAGIGFAVPTPDRTYRDIYVLGTIGRVDPVADLGPPLRAGKPAALVMHRGGRAVGMLRVEPRQPLTDDEVEALLAAAELATAAIVSGRLFEQQDEAMRKLREVDELKTSFLSTASHELRTPVTAIKGFATLLDGSWDGGTDEEQRIYSDRILANARSLDTLVQDLLDLSRLERGRLLAQPGPVDLTATAHQVLERLSVLFSEHELVTDLAGTPPVMADQEGIERILTNLVSNAVHYSPPGTRVTVRTVADDHGAELIVDDEGPGVPTDERPKIFSRFFRGSGDAVVRTRGTGIGLAVVKEYIDQLGGAVSVETAPGGGARFRVWLSAAVMTVPEI
jgi:signal transduction histidine kinase